MADSDKYNLLVEHYDEQSQMTKEYLLTLFVKAPPSNTELTLYDVKAKRVFLKRGVYDQDGTITLDNLHMGATVTICSRRMKVIAYGDAATRDHFSVNGELALVSIDPVAFRELGTVLVAARDAGVALKRIKTVRVPGASAPSVALEFVGAAAVDSLGEVIAASSSSAQYIEVGGMSPAAEKIFESPETTATFDKCSLCIIRPHAVREGLAGVVIGQLMLAGFEISAVQSFSLTRSQSENFYEVYKTVLPSAQYSSMIGELASGVSIVLEVRGGDDVVTSIREFCGPYDVAIAKHLRPESLRAQLGRDNVHNTVHCTDLPEDGVLESQYFFSILPSAGAV